MTFERRISTKYDASTAGFDRGTRKVESGLIRLERVANTRLRSFDRRIKLAVSGVNALGAAFATLGAAGAFNQLLRTTRQVVSRLDEIGKTADTIGLTTDQLQGFRAVARDAGVDVNQTDKALLTFTRRLGQFREGLGAGKVAFEQLGITARRADGTFKSNYEVLLEVSDALSRIDDATTRAAIAADLFDKRNARLVLTLAQGGKSLSAAVDGMKELGRVTSEEAVRAAEALETRLGQLDDQMKREFNESLIESADLLVAFAEAQLMAVRAAGELLSGVSRVYSALKSIKVGDIEILQLLGSAPGGLQSLGRDLAGRGLSRLEGPSGDGGAGSGAALADALIPPAPDVLPPIEVRPARSSRGGGGSSRPQRDVYAELIALAGERKQQIQDEIALARVFGEEQAFLAEKQELLLRARRDDIALTPEKLAQIDAEARQIADLVGELDGLEAARRLVEETSAAMLTTEERVLEKRRELEAMLPNVIALLGDEARAREIVAKAIDRQEAQIRGEDPVGQLIDQLGGAVQGAQSLEEALERVGVKLLEMAATEGFKALFGVESNSPLAQIFTSVAGAVGGFFGGTSPTPRALGGPVYPGQPYVVGERRAELFVPSTSGRILPGVPDAQAQISAVSRGRGAPTIIVGDTILNVQEPGASRAEMQRMLDDSRRKTIREIVVMNDSDPSVLRT